MRGSYVVYWQDLTHHPCLLSDMENCDWVYLSLQLVMHFFYPVLKPRDSSCKQYANLLIYHLAELAERQGLNTLHHKFQLRTIFIIGKVNGSKCLIDTNERLKRSTKGHSKNTQLGSDTEVQLNIIKFKFNCKLKFSSSAIHRVLFQQIIGICFLYGVLHSLSFVTVSLNWSICVFIAKLTASIMR